LATPASVRELLEQAGLLDEAGAAWRMAEAALQNRYPAPALAAWRDVAAMGRAILSLGAGPVEALGEALQYRTVQDLLRLESGAMTPAPNDRKERDFSEALAERARAVIEAMKGERAAQFDDRRWRLST